MNRARQFGAANSFAMIKNRLQQKSEKTSISKVSAAMTAKTKVLSSNPSAGKGGTVTGGMHIVLAPAPRKLQPQAAGRKSAATMVTFGSVTVQVLAPAKNEVRRNIKAGQSALKRATVRLVRSGVKLKVSKGVPLFHAHPTLAGQLVREIDGKSDYGTFVNGSFRAAG